MNPTRLRRILVGAAALALATQVTACGGSSQKASSGPVTLPFWGWVNGQQTVVDAFNASHPKIQIKYTKITGQKELLQQLTNAAKAGDVPCLVQNTAEFVPGFVSQGLLADVTKWVKPSESKFITSSFNNVKVQNKIYGVPTSSAPQFTVYRTDIFKRYGLTPPATWEGFVTVGKELKKHGVHITNYAGEDASTLIGMSMQAGGHWYTIDGNAWKVNFTDPGSEKAAAMIQEIVDNDLYSSLSFADYAAVQRNYDTGGTATRHISTWQMSGMVNNFKLSNGRWALAPWPTFGSDAPKVPAGMNNSGGVTLVTAKCANPQQAAEAALWMSTDSGAVKTMANPATGNGLMPAVTDVTPYLDNTISAKLLGDNFEPAKKIVTDSLSTITSDWAYGPDWIAMVLEMANGWAKVLTKQEKVTDLLSHMQQWTVADLKSRGISVEG